MTHKYILYTHIHIPGGSVGIGVVGLGLGLGLGVVGSGVVPGVVGGIPRGGQFSSVSQSFFALQAALQIGSHTPGNAVLT